MCYLFCMGDLRLEQYSALSYALGVTRGARSRGVAGWGKGMLPPCSENLIMEKGYHYLSLQDEGEEKILGYFWVFSLKIYNLLLIKVIGN